MATTTYFPMCSGNGELPPGYKYAQNASGAILLIIELAEAGILTLVFNQARFYTELSKRGRDLSKNAYEVVKNLVRDTLQTISAFDPYFSIEELQRVLAQKTTNKESQSQLWADIAKGVIEADVYMHYQIAENSRNRKFPLGDCGIIMAMTITGAPIGSIWVFWDPRMVSNDGKIRYVFAEGIRATWPYLLARQVNPQKVPPASDILFPAVERWALQKGANAIRIDPLNKNAAKILTERHGFLPIEPEIAHTYISSFVRELHLFTLYSIPLIKYL